MVTATLNRSTTVVRNRAKAQIRSTSGSRGKISADYEELSGAELVKELKRMGLDQLARVAEVANKHLGIS